MRRVLLTVLPLFALSACATVEGAGEDISDAGEFVSATAREVRDAF